LSILSSLVVAVADLVTAAVLVTTFHFAKAAVAVPVATAREQHQLQRALRIRLPLAAAVAVAVAVEILVDSVSPQAAVGKAVSLVTPAHPVALVVAVTWSPTSTKIRSMLTTSPQPVVAQEPLVKAIVALLHPVNHAIVRLAAVAA
jgi:hypothetical protein